MIDEQQRAPRRRMENATLLQTLFGRGRLSPALGSGSSRAADCLCGPKSARHAPRRTGARGRQLVGSFGSQFFSKIAARRVATESREQRAEVWLEFDIGPCDYIVCVILSRELENASCTLGGAQRVFGAAAESPRGANKLINGHFVSSVQC